MLTLKKSVSIILSMILLISTLFGAIPAQAATTNSKATIELTATCCYADAFEVFNQVNKLRKSKGLSQLKMNSKMLENAMQRAAEIAVDFNHTRPDGSSCFDINDSIHGENISHSYADPTAAFNGWKESSAHYANMISSDYNSIGVGAIIHNGARYWVQVFGTTKSSGITTAPADAKKDFSIYLGTKSYHLSFSVPSKLFVSDSKTVKILGDNTQSPHDFIVNSSPFTWSSSNSSVISVKGSKITALKSGSATITAKSSIATITKKITVAEFGSGNSHQCGDNITWSYNNGTLTFTGSGEMYNYNTEYDGDGLTSTNVPWKNGISGVEKIVVSEGITSVGNSAFACFDNLTTVKLPSTLNSIGDKAFPFCESLKSITIPDSVTKIGNDAFYKCTELTSVVLPNNLKVITDNMFYCCRKLESVNIPESVTKIGFRAFASCNSITNFVIPENVNIIDGYAFFDCTSIKKISIPYGVDEIGKKAFSGCTALTKVTMLDPTSIFLTTDIFSGASSKLVVYGYDSSSAEKFCTENSVTFTQLSGTKINAEATGFSTVYDANPVTKDITVTLKDALNEYNVKFSKGKTFDYSASFDSIRKLGEYWRTEVAYDKRIAGYLLDCGTYPITYCVYSVGSNPTFGTVNIVIKKTTPAFCFDSDTVEIPWYTKGDNSAGYTNTLNNLGDIQLNEIQFVSDNTSILVTDWRGRVVAKKYGECTVTANYPGDDNHYPYTASFNVKINPVGVLLVEDYNLEFFEDKTVNVIRYFGSETVLDVPATILDHDITTIIEKAFRSGSFEEVNIPQGITTIGNSAFVSCYKLNSVNISDTVTTIGDYAFSGCKNLTSVTIPSSVTSIGEKAFGYTAPDENGNASKIEDFVISGYANSAAQKYAEENGFEFICLIDSSYSIGDVDRDGELSILDATAIQMHISRLKVFDDEQVLLADFTHDGSADIMDATGIQLRLVGKA